MKIVRENYILHNYFLNFLECDRYLQNNTLE